MILNDTRYYAERGIEPPAVPGFKWLPKWGTSLDRGNRIEAYIQVRIDKAPKLNYRPGQYLQYRSPKEARPNLYEIRYCYRVASDPHEWHFVLFERKSLVEQPVSEVQDIVVNDLGAGSQIKLVIPELFKDSSDVSAYFSDLYRDANSVLATNKDLIQRGKVISSGPVVTASK